MNNIIKTTGIVCMITGNLIGVGILAIPILAGIAGFWPSIGLMIIACLGMAYSAIILARRACIEKNSLFNYPSLYAAHLGKTGKYLAVSANILILYGLLVAYLSGSAIITAQLFTINNFSIFFLFGCFIVMTFLALCGINLFEKLNIFLIIALVLTFIIIVTIGYEHINIQNLKHTNLAFLLLAIPPIITGFHFHNFIPTAATHIKYNRKILYSAVIIGMLLGLIINIAWLLVSVGDIPLYGHNSLIYSYLKGIPANIPMSHLLHSKFFTISSMLFSLLAIITSYVTNGFSLTAFYNDFTNNYLKIKSRILPIALTYIPPLIIIFLLKNVFLKAIGIVGGIGMLTLFGVLPSLLDYKEGNKKRASCFFMIFAVALAIQILINIHLLQIALPKT